MLSNRVLRLLQFFAVRAVRVYTFEVAKVRDAKGDWSDLPPGKYQVQVRLARVEYVGGRYKTEVFESNKVSITAPVDAGHPHSPDCLWIDDVGGHTSGIAWPILMATASPICSWWSMDRFSVVRRN